MTVLIGDVKDVGLVATEGKVTIRSKQFRPGRQTSGVITPEVTEITLEAGRFRTRDLDPGRMVLEVIAPGVYTEVEFDLPDQRDPYSLADIFTREVEYAPEVVTAARAAAAKAEAAAGRASGAEAAAGRARDETLAAQASVARVVESAIGVVRPEFEDLTARAEAAQKAAVASESAAGVSAREAASSAESAKSDADRAAESAASAAVSTAERIRGEMAGYTRAAAQSEQNAQGSADAARGQAEIVLAGVRDAKRYAAASEADRIRAESAAVRAGEAQEASEAARAQATSARVNAVTAQQASETARDEAVQAAASAKQGAPEGGWARETLAPDVRESLARADKAQTDLPRATSIAPGVVQLSGDLGGTWDDVKVPGLAEKMDKQTVSASVVADALVQRTTGGQVKVATPQADDDAVTKAYADKTYLASSKSDYNPTPLTMALRTQTGTMRVGDAVGPQDAVTKKQLDAKANVSHTHKASEITQDNGTSVATALDNLWRKVNNQAVTVDDRGNITIGGSGTQTSVKGRLMVEQGTRSGSEWVSITDLISRLQSEIQKLTRQVEALRSTAVTSSDYRTIARGTGSRSDTIYIEE
ncbi:hypothetical protein [Corynebacterium lactis]|uniref:Uncharacterized protein n=1 Tax=Corynebacterium lactis RW2-5 TaxID=1408189 RepID=A0A0K2H3C1_9CORY|nr:hypothetical protein [Corynebacterium lactis]ALA68545.1 hypothetical protein CLAC_07260 [Corynebacterium lactis RW2-5]